MGTIYSKCGGLKLDDTTLKIIDGVVALKDTESVTDTVTTCGQEFDAASFEVVDNAITYKYNIETGNNITTCGGLQLDENAFDIIDGVISDSKYKKNIFSLPMVKFENSDVYVAFTADGAMGLDFFIDIDKYTDNPDAYVKITLYSTTTQTLEEVVRELPMDKASGLYRVGVHVAPAYVVDLMDIELYDGDNTLLWSKENYSLKKYCDAQIDKGSEGDIGVIEFCKTIINYASYAQYYFGYKSSDGTEVANSETNPDNIIDDTTEPPTVRDYSPDAEYGLPALSDITKASITTGAGYVRFSGQTIKHPTGMQLTSVSFGTDPDTHIKIDYTITDPDYTIDDFSIGFAKKPTPDGEYPWASNMKVHFVNGDLEIYDIESVNMDYPYEVQISNNNPKAIGTESQTVIIKYSPMSYCKSNVEGGSTNRQNFCKSMAIYNIAARKYFKDVLK